MTSALFGILQLDRGEPYGYAQVAGLVQAWLQDAGGFGAVGLIAYLLYALSTPTDKSQSEKIRVPVSRWMLLMGGISLVCYAALLVLVLTNKGALPPQPPPQPGEMAKIDPPTWHKELQPMALMIAGLFALLGIGEPFARDVWTILRRNVSFGSSGARRFGRSVTAAAADLLAPNRVVAVIVQLVSVLYAGLGGLLYVVDVPTLLNIWIGVLLVAAGVLVCALFLFLLFEAEGPVWAIAKLSFKEAVRSQVLWLFLIVFLPFLFPLNWFYSGKAADELRTTTVFVTIVLSLLTLILAVLLSSMGIPNDIKNLNIFTVVSKPVLRFEIVLGRFFGYLALMTLVLLGMTGVSLVLVLNTAISDKAKEETFKARMPYRGELEFKSIVGAERNDRKEFAGTNVGREFDYRRYIAGSGESPQRIIWRFPTLPAELAQAAGDRVPVEFTFDIYRMTKGEQNKGVFVKFQFATCNAPLRQPGRAEGAEWQWVQKDRERAYRAKIEDLKAQGINVLDLATARPDNKPVWDKLNELTEEFGFYEIAGKEVFDYQVMGVEVPAGLFRNALKGDPGKDAAGNPLPRFSVFVKCESEGQMLGAAQPDLYLLQNQMPYWYNYLKGMVGLWCRLCIVIGLATAISTYMSGVLTLLLTTFIFIVGFFTDHLTDLANNRSVGGGPFQSMSQLVKAEQPTAPLSDSASTRALLFGDKSWSWVIRRVQNMIPDVESFSWSHFVSEGFNVNTEYLVVNLLVTAGYLLPWAIFAYYLMKSREVAA